MEGVATANIGVCASRQGRYEEALEYHKEGLKIVREQNNRYTEMQGLNEMGEIHQNLKQWDQSLECHLEAIEIAKSIGVPTERWQYELNAAKDYEGKGDFQKAIEYYKRAAETVAGIKNKIKSERLREGFSDQERQIEVYRRLIDLLLRMGQAEEALRYIEESKSKIIRDAFGDIKPETTDEELKETLQSVDKIEKKREAIEKQIQTEKQKPEAEQDKTKLTILSNTLATTEGEFNQWMLKLKFQNRKMYDALTIKPTTLGDIQNEIPGDTLILEYFVSSDQLYVFCIGKNYFFAKSVSILEDDLVGLVREYSRLAQDPHSPRRRNLKNNAVKLYDILIRPIEDVMEPFHNIVVVRKPGVPHREKAHILYDLGDLHRSLEGSEKEPGSAHGLWQSRWKPSRCLGRGQENQRRHL
jgi:tetratricopeptide (TPR) repeat protein